MCRVAGSAFSWRVRSTPFMPGSWMSIRIRSGGANEMLISALPASCALSTSKPSSLSTKVTSSTFMALSSTTRIRPRVMSVARGRRRRQVPSTQVLEHRRELAAALADDRLGGAAEHRVLLGGEDHAGPDEDRRVTPLRHPAQRVEHGEAVDGRHHQIEHDGSGAQLVDLV